MTRVLVVEDQRALADSLRIAIDAEPDLDCVGVARRAHEALRLTVEQHPDVVLMDIHLPDVDGIEGTKWIKASDSEVRVLILTADAAPELFEDATAAGAAGFIAKDTPFHNILMAIRTPPGKTIPVGGATFVALAKQQQREEPPQVARGENRASALSRGHVKNVMRKLGAHSRLDAVVVAIRTDLRSLRKASLSSLLLRPTRPPLLWGIAVAALCIVIETLVAYPVGLVSDGASLGVVHLPGVLLVAAVWGLRLGALTVVASTVAFAVFHLPPTPRYVDSNFEEWLVLAVFLAVALLAGFVADLARSRAVEIQKRHRDAELAAELAHVLLRAEVESIQHGGGLRIGEGEVPVAGTTVDREDLYVVALRDVARRRQQERELQSALDHQTSVVAIAAHELQNPLAAIRAFTHPLRNPHYPGTPQQRTEIADRIAERAEVLQALVRKLLTASRIDTQPKRRPQECVPVLQLILDLLAESDTTAQDVHVSCSPALEAFVDRGEFCEMLVNYLDNAFTHGSPPLDVRVAERDGWIEVRVCDGDPGVPEEFRPHLFERFSRGPDTARQAQGSGLGLWIVRSLARANGGDAFYEPGESGGACFGLRLPQARPAWSGVGRIGGGASPGSSGAPSTGGRS
ncbi:MAG: hypothetical protein JWP48_777 [Actinoallomurus sp.]|jgi:K+-sensing histidine kinase KdpD|nr:hypothetical protein [Actinoallomurus sp.]